MTLILLCLTALTLGFRHGLDFDHIAAMLDMAGSSATETPEGKAPQRFRIMQVLRNVKLPALYVLGHVLMVFILGFTALAFGAVIPQWLNGLMERIVGVTLVALSIYLFYSLLMFLSKGHELKLRSRWMLLFSVVTDAWHRLKAQFSGRPHTHNPVSINWDSKGAFIVGLIHGFGAETGTQVLLFASVAGTGSLATGFFMLSAFGIGMSISTLAIAVSVSMGLTSSAYFKPAMFVLGMLAAIFSLVVGLYFCLGASGHLPSF